MPDDFELFGLPRRFAQEPAEIEAAWRRLQSAAHPDRVAADPVAQRLAVQASARINEAHRRLRDPLTRAAYLCELAGQGAAQGSAVASAFLMQQMEWREALDASTDAAGLDAVDAQVRAAEADAMAGLQAAIDASADWKRASDLVTMLQFLKRLRSAIAQRRDDFDTADAHPK